MKVGDDLSRNDAKRDAIAAVAERKIGMRKFWSLADVRQAIFSLAEGACPCVDTSRSRRGNMSAK